MARTAESAAAASERSRLYHITFDASNFYVQARDYTDAIRLWKEHVAVLWGDDYDGTEQPESVSLIHDEAVITGRMTCSADERELLDGLYEAHPELRADPDNFDGWYADWDEIIDACKSCGEEGYSESPIEMIYRLRNRMGDLATAAAAAQCACSVAERDSGHLVGCWMPALSEAIAASENGATR